MSNVQITFVMSILGLLGSSHGHFKINYQWQVGNLWSSCSQTCGVGTQYKLPYCTRKTFMGTIEKVEENLCKDLKKPNTMIAKSCHFGNCPGIKGHEFVWKVGTWSSCSASCGGEGVQSREVQCILAFFPNGFIITEDNNCHSALEPNKIEKCGYVDCPPEFFKTPWNKCSKSIACRPGIRRRKINCMVTLKTGISKSVPIGNCYRRFRPPSAWEKCFDDPVYQNHCKMRNTINRSKSKRPLITVSHMKIHQMRNVKKLKLSVGQTAFVLPHTRLVIKCPVNNYPAADIQWAHNKSIYKYAFSIRSRIHVNQKGYLIIKKFLPPDRGVWTCVAGITSSEINILENSPSQGFLDWLSRKYYFKQDIVFDRKNETAKYIKPVSYQWVVSQWSVCTRTCGTAGVQTRNVKCEQIEQRYFMEMDNDKCVSQNINKPTDSRSCVVFRTCPFWKVGELETQKCTNNCVDIGKSAKNLKTTCMYEMRIVPSSNCDSGSQPHQTCSNPDCTAYWKVGEWSPCSSSCGESGLMVRTISCRWRPDDSPARNICEKQKLKMPILIKTCNPPRCNLACLDLSSFCGLKKLCAIDHYQHFCCKTCSSD